MLNYQTVIAVYFPIRRREGPVMDKMERNAKSLWNKAGDSFVKAADQNNDGAFDMEDVAAIAETL